mmetsp:Transcript_39563/g.93136  ORF Transcript_39563/g.93136 Transcript_39563/m.93136 type:complete len:201 (+) Transcript_39563:210-812(+)
MKRLRLAPRSSGARHSRPSCPSACSSCRLCAASLAKPMPGSATRSKDGTPAARAASRRAPSSTPTALTTPPASAAYAAIPCIDCGVPRVCISTAGTPSSAKVASIRASAAPPETSLTASAPARTAARATAAQLVSTEMGMPSPSARSASISGSTRASSSASPTAAAPGRVETPPMSSMSAPSNTICTAALRATSSPEEVK